MKIINLTDHPSKTSQAIRIRGGEIKPGQSITAEYDEKLELLKGILAIDEVPKWYSDWKDSQLPSEVTISALQERFRDVEVPIEIKESPKEVTSKKKNSLV